MTVADHSSTQSNLSVSFGYLAEESLIDLIRGARRAIAFVGPGLTIGVAQTIRNAAQQNPSLDLKITIDLDPEVCRLGFGELEAIEILQGLALQKPGILTQQGGLRLCALTIDGATVIFPPVPRLVVAPSEIPPAASGSITISPQDSSAIGQQIHKAIEPEETAPEDVQELKQDLQDNPPLPFDLSQKVHVFNAQFEFVEFELKGLALSRKKVPLPPFLMGLSRDPKTQKLLQSSFRLIGDDTELSSDVVLKLKKRIIDRYLITLPNYGTVILRAQKPRFERSIRLLKRFIGRYQKKVEKLLADEMKKNQETVAKMLFPLVRQNVPSDWRKYFSGPPSDAELRELLSDELARAFGKPADHFQKMSCSVIFKGITYELLSDKEFVETARKHIKSAVRLHIEYDAARARS
jgi:hypothetical protein